MQVIINDLLINHDPAYGTLKAAYTEVTQKLGKLNATLEKYGITSENLASVNASANLCCYLDEEDMRKLAGEDKLILPPRSMADFVHAARKAEYKQKIALTESNIETLQILVRSIKSELAKGNMCTRSAGRWRQEIVTKKCEMLTCIEHLSMYQDALYKLNNIVPINVRSYFEQVRKWMREYIALSEQKTNILLHYSRAKVTAKPNPPVPLFHMQPASAPAETQPASGMSSFEAEPTIITVTEEGSELPDPGTSSPPLHECVWQDMPDGQV